MHRRGDTGTSKTPGKPCGSARAGGARASSVSKAAKPAWETGGYEIITRANGAAAACCRSHVLFNRRCSARTAPAPGRCGRAPGCPGRAQIWGETGGKKTPLVSPGAGSWGKQGGRGKHGTSPAGAALSTAGTCSERGAPCSGEPHFSIPFAPSLSPERSRAAPEALSPRGEPLLLAQPHGARRRHPPRQLPSLPPRSRSTCGTEAVIFP